MPTLVKAGAPGSQPPQRPSLSHFRVHSLPGLFPVGIGDIDYCRLTLRVHWGSKREIRVRAVSPGDGTNDVLKRLISEGHAVKKETLE